MLDGDAGAGPPFTREDFPLDIGADAVVERNYHRFHSPVASSWPTPIPPKPRPSHRPLGQSATALNRETASNRRGGSYRSSKRIVVAFMYIHYCSGRGLQEKAQEQ